MTILKINILNIYKLLNNEVSKLDHCKKVKGSLGQFICCLCLLRTYD